MSDRITSQLFTLEIQMGNDAMQSPDDLANALIVVANRVREWTQGSSGPIVDGNGNQVGTYWTEDNE